MKKITLLLSFIFCAVLANAQLLLNENFDYTAAGLIGQGGWAISGTSTTNPISVTDVTSTPIIYSGYPTSGIGKEVTLANTGQDVTHAITTQTTGSVYFSVLVNITSAGTGDYFIHLGEPLSTSAFFGRTFVKLDGTKIAFGIQNTSGGTPVPTYTTSTFDLNTNYLLVIKVDVITGTSSLIVNPVISVTEPTTDWISSSTPTNGGVGGTSVPSASGIGEINIRQGSSSAGVAPILKLDGIRVATSWAALFSTTGISTPTADILNVSIAGKTLTVTNSPSSTVEIFNTVGAKVQTVELVNGSADLNIAKGLYIVRVGNKSAKIRL